MHLFFSTPIWASKIPNYEKINTEMLNYILDLQNKDPEGVFKSNFKGWHSKDFYLKARLIWSFIKNIQIKCTI